MNWTEEAAKKATDVESNHDQPFQIRWPRASADWQMVNERCRATSAGLVACGTVDVVGGRPPSVDGEEIEVASRS